MNSNLHYYGETILFKAKDMMDMASHGNVRAIDCGLRNDPERQPKRRHSFPRFRNQWGRPGDTHAIPVLEDRKND
jgi:hypothetical protein